MVTLARYGLPHQWENYDRIWRICSVLHGMIHGYSASMLSLSSRIWNKTCVFTGAQLPFQRWRSECSGKNLMLAVGNCDSLKSMASIVPEVMYFSSIIMLLRGNRLKSSKCAFRCFWILEELSSTCRIKESWLTTHISSDPTVESQQELINRSKLDNNVMVIKLFQGLG